MKEEIWKDIPDYEGHYKISNHGRVKSLKRKVFGKNNSSITLKERILKDVNNKGYRNVTLYLDGVVRKTYTIHKLMGITFLNHVYKSHDLVIDHIDGDKTNNRLENLQLISCRENVIRSIDKTSKTSKYVGVHYSEAKRQWMATLHVNKKQYRVRCLNSEEEAKKAYDKLCLELL